MMSAPVECLSSSSVMWPGVPLTLRVTSAKAASNASSLPCLIVAYTITRAGIGSPSDSLDVCHDLLNRHRRGRPKLTNGRRERVLGGAPLEPCERLAAFPIAHDDITTRIGRVAKQRLAEVARLRANTLRHAEPDALELFLAARLDLDAQRRADHEGTPPRSSRRCRRATTPMSYRTRCASSQ